MMIEYYKKVVFENYANFSGRARRSEFWYFVLFNFIISIVLQVIDAALGLHITLAEMQGQEVAIGLLSTIYGLAVFIPGLAVWVRRLQDTEKSGLLLLTVLIPIVNFVMLIVLIVFAATEGTSGVNKYGKDPKKPELDLEDHLVD